MIPFVRARDLILTLFDLPSELTCPLSLIKPDNKKTKA
jgi:hypothetical protein